MRSETMRDVMLVLFTIVVIGLIVYAIFVEPVLDKRAERRWQESQSAAGSDESHAE